MLPPPGTTWSLLLGAELNVLGLAWSLLLRLAIIEERNPGLSGELAWEKDSYEEVSGLAVGVVGSA